MDRTALPRFEKPPVDEVALGVQFLPLTEFLVPHFGQLWDVFRADYPRCEETTPLAPIVEGPQGPSVNVDLSGRVPLPRIWFLQEDGPGVIQVQRDRFLVNWRRRKPEDAYPGFRAVRDQFRRLFVSFEAFLGERALGVVAPEQYELTYVDVVAQGEGWDSLADLGRVFPDLAWRQHADRFLSQPQAMSWQSAFPLPQGQGRLHVAFQLALRSADSKPVIRMDMTARGIGADHSREAMWVWFDLAHETIVRAFVDLTAEEVQRELWRRQP